MLDSKIDEVTEEIVNRVMERSGGPVTEVRVTAMIEEERETKTQK